METALQFIRLLTPAGIVASLPWLACVFVLLLSAAAAVAMRNLIHCALAVTLSFMTLGLLFIGLGAEFVGLAQILVYVGAVAVLMVFAILLTRPTDIEPQSAVSARELAATILEICESSVLLSRYWCWPVCSLRLRSARVCVRLTQQATSSATTPGGVAPVAAIGQNLVADSFLPLQATGLLLTAALVGAAVLAREDRAS